MRYLLSVILCIGFPYINQCFSKTPLLDISLNDDSVVVRSFLNSFKSAYNLKDTNFISEISIAQQEYNNILNILKENQVGCLTLYDETYSVKSLMDEYVHAIGTNIRIDSIIPLKVTELYGCGGVEFKKIDTKAYFNNKTLELPLALVFIRDFNKQYWLMSQIFNYRILSNE